MHARYLCGLLIAILVGCGPTHTAGTKGLSKKDLAVLSIPQLPEETHVQIHAVQFDGEGDQYSIGSSRDFYLRPGDHTATFTFTARLPGIAGIFLPSSSLTLPGPKNIPLGSFSAGKAYELAPTMEGIEKFLNEGGGLSLVREKPK